MATVTPNFNWPVPTSTDLVKDGATAIEALGDSIDASLVDLKGGTSGQVLAKNSNTDMDFVWVTDAAGDITGVTAGTGISGGGTSGTVTVTNSMATAIDAKGDLVAGTAADTFSRLAVGANDTVLTADSTAATGLKWAAPASGGGMTLISSGNLSGSADIVVGSIPATYNNLQLWCKDWTWGSDNYLGIRCNADTGSNYTMLYTYSTNGTAAISAQIQNDTYLYAGYATDSADANNFAIYDFINYANTTTRKVIRGSIHSQVYDNSFRAITLIEGEWTATPAAINSITIRANSAFTGGTYELWGVK